MIIKKEKEGRSVKYIIRNYGVLYSEDLGIKLKTRKKQELFKWFLASILFGHRITETIAKNTYNTFRRYKLLDPKKIIKAGWDFLINPIMRQGGYVRYDEKTSNQILDDCKMLLNDYNGDLNLLHKKALDRKDLELKMEEFYGVGPVTANIFLRELRHIWKKADPEPLPIVKKVARRYRIDLKRFNRKTEQFVKLEAALIRLRKFKKINGLKRPKNEK